MLNKFLMKEYDKALTSRYVIDGVEAEATPYELLIECSNEAVDLRHIGQPAGKILDEQVDPPLSSHLWSDDDFCLYLEKVTAAAAEPRTVPLHVSDSCTRMNIASALTGTLWLDGHFKSGNILLDACWHWNDDRIGNMAAFYKSVYAANEYVFDLGIHLHDFNYLPEEGSCRLEISAAPDQLSEAENEEFSLKESPYKSRHSWTDGERLCPEAMVEDPDSWIIYIPFDTCAMKLGGSLLSQACNHAGEPAPDIQDPDYTIDCYEVVRELVEDRIIIAGTEISDGGLACALKRLCGQHGMEIGLGGLRTSYPDASNTQLMFAEVPGVLIQIRDIDYDYVDAQLLLQDVAYYPLGHPDLQSHELRIAANNEVADILRSLLDQASEGED